MNESTAEHEFGALKAINDHPKYVLSTNAFGTSRDGTIYLDLAGGFLLSDIF